MEEIKIGSHVGMAGKEMFLASVKEAERYGENVLMLYTGAPQNTRRKEIKDLNIEAGWDVCSQKAWNPGKSRLFLDYYYQSCQYGKGPETYLTDLRWR